MYNNDLYEVYFRLHFDMELLINKGESHINGICDRVTWINRENHSVKQQIVSLWLMMSKDERQELFENVSMLRAMSDKKKRR